jgi:asparagine N-glycosylation enzyme membrane subunit Stt3
MKKSHFILSFSLLIWLSITSISCNDEEGNGLLNNSIKFKIDGNLIEFKDQTKLFGFYGSNGSQHTLLIQSDNGEEEINIQIFDDTPITVATYTGFDLNSNNVIEGITIGVFTNDGIVYTTDATNVIGSVIVTDLGDNLIKGTFSGELRDPETGNSVTLTEGEFTVKRVN